MFDNLFMFLPFMDLNYYNQYFLIISFILFIIIFITNKKFDLLTSLNNINNIKNLVLILFTLSFLIFNFYIFIVINFKTLLSIQNLVYFNYELNNYCNNIYDTASMIIIYLCYLIGFISILTLGDRFWSNNYYLSPIFLYFIIIINFLCKSNSVFELFFYYELLLLPSIFFVYKSGYTKKSYQANVYFFIWTQFGSLFVLLATLYISAKCGTTQFIILKNFHFTQTEKYFLYLTFFFGFGVKVPLWPFHFWLVKVHVEAPSGFSIFLSGFLVKTAIYCFYKIILILNVKSFYLLPVILCILGMLDSSFKMWGQVDIKKLIAYATVQEMNCIYLLFNFGDSWAINTGLIFLLAHGFLSALMFFLVECIYKRYGTRSITKISGISYLHPNLSLSIWGMLILFFGFPGTIKFYAEIQLCFFIIQNDVISGFIIMFISIFINTLGFAHCWFSVLYGHPGYNKPTIDLTKEEILIIIFMLFLSIICSFFVFLL